MNCLKATYTVKQSAQKGKVHTVLQEFIYHTSCYAATECSKTRLRRIGTQGRGRKSWGKMENVNTPRAFVYPLPRPMTASARLPHHPAFSRAFSMGCL